MPVGGATAASSLYSGIFNSEAEAKKKPPASEAGPASEEASSSTSGASNNIAVATDSAKESSASDGTTTTATKPQVWSAALRFAPRKNINSSQANRSRKPAASIISSTFSAAPIPADSVAAAAGEEEKATPKAKPNQSESAAATSSSNGESQRTSTTGWTKLNQIGESSKLPLRIDALHTGDADDEATTSLPIITAPPELTIPEEELQRDVALFASFAEKRGETRNTTHRGEQEWQEDEDEDEDVNGFTNTEAGRKAKRRRYKKKRNTSPGHPGGGPSASLRMDADYDARVPNDYNEFKDIIRKRRQAIKQTALVREARERQRYHDKYNEMERGGESAEEEEEEEEEEDDDAYKRKRMNRFAPPAIYRREGAAMAASFEEIDSDDEKPYLSPSPPPQPPAFEAPVAPLAAPPSIAAETGEEAYLRRLAMSQSQVSPSAAPGSEQQSQPPSAPASIDFAARAAAAASIAAKLAKAGPSQEVETPKKLASSSVTSFLGSSSSSASTDSSSFAQRLMEKQGWKEGEALGAEGNKGLLDPILAKKVETERKKQQQIRGGGGPSDRDNRLTMSNRGTIVNSHEEEKKREEREKYGTPSEVILLENMVSLHDIDDGLSEEIGEECSKHGYVERVFIWPQGPHGVRIFVRFSGMAGAWRCVKDLDGRFFGGKVVKARYYPLHEFERGHYMRVFG